MKRVLVFLTALRLISLDSLHAAASDSPIDIVKASVDWFFEAAGRSTVKERPCRNWGYALEKPIRRSEDIGHGGKDIQGLYRVPFGAVRDHAPDDGGTGEQDRRRHRRPPGAVRRPGQRRRGKRAQGAGRAYWIGLCEFRPDPGQGLYDREGERALTSPRTVSHLLWQKHRLGEGR